MFGKSGDTLRCKSCGNERVISQSWLDGLMRRYNPTSARRATMLDTQTLSRLKCSKCEGKFLQLVESSLDATAKAYVLCSACGGDGGIEGRCYKCFGTGFNEEGLASPPQ